MKSIKILDPRKGSDGKACNREITIFEDGSGEDSLGKYQFAGGELLQWYHGAHLKSVASGEIVTLFQDALERLK